MVWDIWTENLSGLTGRTSVTPSDRARLIIQARFEPPVSEHRETTINCPSPMSIIPDTADRRPAPKNDKNRTEGSDTPGCGRCMFTSTLKKKKLRRDRVSPTKLLRQLLRLSISSWSETPGNASQRWEPRALKRHYANDSKMSISFFYFILYAKDIN